MDKLTEYFLIFFLIFFIFSLYLYQINEQNLFYNNQQNKINMKKILDLLKKFSIVQVYLREEALRNEKFI